MIGYDEVPVYFSGFYYENWPIIIYKTMLYYKRTQFRMLIGILLTVPSNEWSM